MLRTLFKGMVTVETVQPGYKVLGYSYKHRRLQEIVVTAVDQIPRAMMSRLVIPQVGYIDVCQGTAVYDARKQAECFVIDQPQILIGSCSMNPKQMVLRPVTAYTSKPIASAVVISWDEEPETYLWSEGLLVGTDSDKSIPFGFG
jgi:hypothetical protein